MVCGQLRITCALLLICLLQFAQAKFEVVGNSRGHSVRSLQPDVYQVYVTDRSTGITKYGKLISGDMSAPEYICQDNETVMTDEMRAIFCSMQGKTQHKFGWYYTKCFEVIKNFAHYLFHAFKIICFVLGLAKVIKFLKRRSGSKESEGKAHDVLSVGGSAHKSTPNSGHGDKLI